QVALSLSNVIILSSIVVAWAMFARDSDDANRYSPDPDLQWLLQRGGTILMFGRPGNSQYFRYGMYSYGSITSNGEKHPNCTFIRTILCKILMYQNRLARHTDEMAKRIFAVLSSQLLNTAFVFTFPVVILCLFTFIDTSSIPGVIFAPMRSSILLVFCLNPTQTSLVYILRNPVHKK
ncbi:hypothetical protein PENTCL1PPCAC_25343, partial [Pristionchus entomophagus]